MSIFYNIAIAMNGPETERDWTEAREDARSYAISAPWLEEVLLHHSKIADAFALIRAETTADSRRDALTKLFKLWNGNAAAEDLAIFPALSANGYEDHATIACAQKARARCQFERLESLAPMDCEFDIELGHLECAIKHHMYQEESIWFLDFIEYTLDVDHDNIAKLYGEAFTRFMNGTRVTASASQRPSVAASSSASRSPIVTRQQASLSVN